jgi:leucyl-tRNA synthetase
MQLRRAAHRAVAWVTDDLDALRFNRAVARIYELANAISGAPADVPGAVKREALEILVHLTGPMMPHLAESCWEALGHSSMLIDQAWPKADPALVRADTIVIAVQVDGKRRGEIAIDRGSNDETVKAAALALDSVERALAGKSPRRIIHVPERIVNIVT